MERPDGKHDSGVNTRAGLEPYEVLPPKTQFEDPMQDEMPHSLPDDKSIPDKDKRDPLEDDTTYVKEVAAEEKGPLQNSKTATASLPPDVNNDEHHEGTELAKSSSISSTTKKKKKKKKVTTI